MQRYIITQWWYHEVIEKIVKVLSLTINDRSTGLCWIRLLKGKNAKALAEKTIEALTPFKGLIYTITSDNGREFYEYKYIAKSLGIDFYFAHPISLMGKKCK